MIGQLEAARREREAREAVETAKRERLARIMGRIRLAAILPLVVAFAWLFWRIGYESGFLAGLASSH